MKLNKRLEGHQENHNTSMKDGVIADSDVAEQMIKFYKKVHKGRSISNQNCYLVLRATNVERRAIRVSGRCWS